MRGAVALIRSVVFRGPKAYAKALDRDESLALMPLSMAAAMLGVEVATVQGYIRRGLLREIVIGESRDWIGLSTTEVKAMRLSKLNEVRRLATLARPILLGAARDRTTVEYGAELMEPLGLDHRHTRDRDLIGKALGSISRRTYNKNNTERKCMLTVLAVRKDSGMPNSVFFELAKELGAMPQAMSEDRFFRHHKKTVFGIYG